MRRRLLTLLAALALGLLVLWGISYLGPLGFRYARTPQEVWFLDAERGRVRVLRQWVTPAAVNGLAADARTLLTITLRDAAGRVVTTSRDPYRRDTWNPWWFDENAGNHQFSLGNTPAGLVDLKMNFVCVPLWFLVALLAAPPLGGWTWQWHARRARQRQGLCQVCGYDLRATPQRCPECGTAVAKQE